MSQSWAVDPLLMTVADDATRFTFNEPVTNVLDIPPTFEAKLRELADAHKDLIQGKPVHVDLESVPALSSRQLGMILTVREVMKPFGNVLLLNISESVKQLLQLTGTDRFFADSLANN